MKPQQSSGPDGILAAMRYRSANKTMCCTRHHIVLWAKNRRPVAVGAAPLQVGRGYVDQRVEVA